MKKLLIAALTSMLFFGSSATIASGNLESGLTPISAENMMNYILCKGKKPEDTVKSRHRVVDGKIPKIKCADANKIVSKARASNK
ncbi:MAG: hypothetical protein OEX11_06735 [Nitrosomonas sp.]|nr:hypothetical protein [Nitrosomonas sp.]